MSTTSGATLLRRGLPVALAGLMLALLVTGIVRQYSPVPFWDMWDGYIGFYLRLKQGDMGAWLDFQNEHRIVITRLLFFADLAWAQGLGWIPLLANVLLATLAALCLCFALRRLTPAWEPKDRLPWYALIVGVLAFWSQEQNFTWAFQPQFFLAFLLPLACYVFAADAAIRPTARYAFTFACLTGLLALGSMANGVLALPLMAILTMAFAMGKRRVLCVLALTVTGVAVSRLGYHSVEGSQQAHLPWDQPFAVARYTLLYLGSPVGNVLPVTRITLVLAALTGIVSACGTLLACVRGWHLRHRQPLRLALATFSAYVCLSALATALGRLELGPVSALSGRYTTPALMAFAANIIALLPDRAAPGFRGWLPGILLLIMMPAQIPASASAHALTDTRMLAALALELQVDDPTVLQSIYPRPEAVLATAKAARDARVGIFALPPLLGANEHIGKPYPHGECAPVNLVTWTIADKRYVRMALTGLPENRTTGPVLLVDENAIIIGMALPIQPPADTDGGGAHLTGYALRDALSDHRRLNACVVVPSL